MASPATRQQLKDYAFRRLGFPVIEINVDDSQVEDRLDDSLQFFAEYHFDGVEKMFYKHQVTADDITNGYIDMDNVDSSIISVTRLFQFSDSTINMFDIRYQMALNDFYGLRSGLSNIAYYDSIKRHLSLIQQTLDPEKNIRFSRVTNRLYVDMDWSEDIEVGEFLAVEAYTVLDPETYTEIYNDRLLKQYITAQIKRQWGENMKKFQGIQMPGGVTLNGETIYQEAVQEIAQIEEEMQLKYELPPTLMVG